MATPEQDAQTEAKSLRTAADTDTSAAYKQLQDLDYKGTQQEQARYYYELNRQLKKDGTLNDMTINMLDDKVPKDANGDITKANLAKAQQDAAPKQQNKDQITFSMLTLAGNNFDKYAGADKNDGGGNDKITKSDLKVLLKKKP